MTQPADTAPPATDNGRRRRLIDHHATMWRIRAFERAAEDGLAAGHVNGAVHMSIGQEAVPTGVAAHLITEDVIASTHRGHGHSIAKGADLNGMMLELFGRAGGACAGKGGSMHIADFKVGMLGANGVVGAGLPIAVGAAQGLRLLGRAAIAVCYFGDGAANRGPFLESLNWAAVFKLPVLFVCEDNNWSATTRTAAMSAGPGIAARSEALGVPALSIDGNDVEAVDEAAGRLIGLIRGGSGPRLLHARTYRLKGHTVTDAAPYRPADEVAARWEDDPIARNAAELKGLGLDDDEIAAIEVAETARIAATVTAALAAPLPDTAAAFDDVQDIGRPRPGAEQGQAWSTHGAAGGIWALDRGTQL
ncbi:thiamine pyrophosphate-dependent dehydrogenase E1 component subunit alpha [Tistrella sp. BH-R2-4]|uniref:Thiamine pyrophosphate-dependent dehydrogenase E1 component subunit alpha n=1 Tax=Tistrella arctica TaxID=3133430 RepID=A0ABU9YQR8_9PROT